MCPGNHHWIDRVLRDHSGTIWMDPVPLGGLQEQTVKWTF